MVIAKENSGLKIFILLLVGMIVSGIVSIMYLTGSINLERFYDVGELYDITSLEIRAEGENWHYNYSTKLIEVSEENTCHYFDVSRQNNWNYLCVELKNISKVVQSEVRFLDRDGNVLYTMEQGLQNGDNILRLQKEEFYRFCLVIKEPCSFHIQRIQLRERLQDFGWQEWAAVFGFVFVCWLILMMLFLFVKPRGHKAGRADKRKGIWIEKLQEAYSHLLCQAEGMRQRLSAQKISQLRRILFLVSLVIVYVMFVTGWRWKVLPQRRMVLLLGICLLLIAFLSWEANRRAVNWKNPLMYAWFSLWIMCIVSEFVVEKRVQNLGIFMLGCMAPLYMAWNSMRKPERLLKDFLAAMRWSYYFSCFFCILFRTYTPGIRYLGMYQNPNSFAGYLVTVNIAFLIWLDENLNKERFKTGTLCRMVLSLASIGGFLVLTDSLTSMVAYIMQWIVFIWKQFPNEKTEAYQKHLRRFVVLFLFSIVLVWIPGRWCLANVSSLLNTSISFRGDVYVTLQHPLSMVVNAAEEQKTGEAGRMLTKLYMGDWDALFSNRTEIWRCYLRQLNLFGHRGYLQSLGGVKMHAHNAVLQMMHYYGVFTAVPYLVMLYYSVKYGVTVIFSRRRLGMNLFFLMAVVNYIVQGLTEDMATPFFYISWLTYFIALGGLVNQPEKRDIRG